MGPTDTLRHEHDVVLLVLKAADREGKGALGVGRLTLTKVEQMLDFFRVFVDRCHHAKEERHLFPTLLKRGIAGREDCIRELLQQHDAGRAHVRAMAGAYPKAKSGEAKATQDLGDHLLAYASLLTKHIETENKCLLPAADRLLTPEDQASLNEAFEKIETEEIGEGTHEKYHQLAHDLAKG
jgi:hemerythrin-like domain-containing protein